jgi:hypothetical protein
MMAELAASSTHNHTLLTVRKGIAHDQTVSGGRLALLLIALFLVNMFCQIDRILPFILKEAITVDLSLSDTQIRLLAGAAFAICYARLSLPLARASERGSPRPLLVSCMVVWSAMTARGGLPATFLFLAFTRFGVALGEAGATLSGHAPIAPEYPAWMQARGRVAPTPAPSAQPNEIGVAGVLRSAAP